MINLSINLENASAKWKNAFPKYRKKIEHAAACAFLNAKKPAAFKERNFEINILLTTDSNVKKLNKNYRGKDSATNVLSFPQINLNGFKKADLAIFPIQSYIPLGDIVLANELIKKEAKQQGKTFEDHVVHLIVHGVLHLLGYDHMNNPDADKMEKLECKTLESLDYPNPYEAA